METAIRSVEVGADGGYALETDSVGVFSLWFTGVGHMMQNRLLLLAGHGGTIEIDARLGTHDYVDDLSAVAVIGEFNNFSFGDGSRAMELQDDGTYVLEVEWGADTLAYQLINIVSGRSINGAESDHYVYDGGGTIAAGRPEVYEEFLYAAMRENPSESVKTDALFQPLWTAHTNHNEEEARILYSWLVSEYPTAWQAEYARSEFDPNRAEASSPSARRRDTRGAIGLAVLPGGRFGTLLRSAGGHGTRQRVNGRRDPVAGTTISLPSQHLGSLAPPAPRSSRATTHLR